MKARILRSLLLLSVAFCSGEALGVSPAVSQNDKSSLERITQDYFAAQKDFRPTDLITRADAEKIFAAAKDSGLKIANRSPLIERIPGPESFLQRYFATASGKVFMRKSATDAAGYAALERVAEQPDGTKLIKRLSKEKGGSKLITYLSSTKGGKRLQTSLKSPGRSRRGRDKPAEPIYMAKQLISEVQIANP